MNSEELAEAVGILLTNASVPEEVRISMQERLDSFANEYPDVFLSEIIQLILNASGQNVQYYFYALVSQVKHKVIFTSDVAINNTFAQISEAFLPIFNELSTFENENITFAELIGFVSAELYKKKPDVSTITEFVINAIQTNEVGPEFGQIILQVMIDGTHSLCNLPIETLIDILSMESPMNTELRLLCAVASVEQNSDIHTLFDQVLSNINETNVESAFKIISVFAEHSFNFLEPHIEKIIVIILGLLQNSSSIMVECLYLIQIFYEQGEEIINNYFENIFEIFICALMTVTEETPLKIDHSDNSPYTVACEVLRIIRRKLPQSNSFIDKFVTIITSMIEEGGDKMLASITFLNYGGMITYYDNYDFLSFCELSQEDIDLNETIKTNAEELFVFLRNIVIDENQNIRLRYQSMNSMQMFTSHNIQIELLSSLVEIEADSSLDEDFRLAAINQLNSATFFQYEGDIDKYNEIFQSQILILNECENLRIIKKIIKLISNMISSSHEFAKQKTNEVFDIANTLLVETDESELVIPAINLVLSVVKNRSDELSDELKSFCSDLFDVVASLEQSDQHFSSKKHNILQQAFINLIQFKPQEEMAGYIEQLIEQILSALAEEPNIQYISIYDTVPSSVYTIPGSDPTIRLIVEKTFVEYAESNVSTLKSIISILKSEYNEAYLNQTIEAINHNYEAENPIGEILKKMIEIEYYLFIFILPENTVEFFNYILQHFLFILSLKFSKDVHKSVIDTMSFILKELRNKLGLRRTNAQMKISMMLTNRNQEDREKVIKNNQAVIQMDDVNISEIFKAIIDQIAIILPNNLKTILENISIRTKYSELNESMENDEKMLLSSLSNLCYNMVLISPNSFRVLYEEKLNDIVRNYLKSEIVYVSAAALQFHLVYYLSIQDADFYASICDEIHEYLFPSSDPNEDKIQIVADFLNWLFRKYPEFVDPGTAQRYINMILEFKESEVYFEYKFDPISYDLSAIFALIMIHFMDTEIMNENNADEFLSSISVKNCSPGFYVLFVASTIIISKSRDFTFINNDYYADIYLNQIPTAVTLLQNKSDFLNTFFNVLFLVLYSLPNWRDYYRKWITEASDSINRHKYEYNIFQKYHDKFRDYALSKTDKNEQNQ